MARPRTEIGTYGKITTVEIAPDLHEARARIRLRNGRYKRPKRRGKSKAAAERALKKALAKISGEVAGKAINGDTRFGHVLDLWLKAFEQKVEEGKRAAKSLYDYQDTAAQLRTHMGDLSCREAENPGLCDDVIKAIRAEAAKSNRSKGGSGYASAKRARTVLSGVCGYAVLHQAMKTNPAKAVEAIEQGEQDEIRALAPGERGKVLTLLREYSEKKATAPRVGVRGQAWRDLPDLGEAMLATGGRLGEVLACDGPSVVPTKQTVRLDHHLVRIEGVGMARVKNRKGNRPAVNPRYPTWAAPMFTRRKLAAGEGPLFPTWNGQWQDPTNPMKRLREAFDAVGYGWMASRMFRHTVGTHLGQSGVSSEEIGDQLGNTADVVNKHYRAPQVTNLKVAGVLETMFGEDEQTGS